jgi:hypothetical protein
MQGRFFAVNHAIFTALTPISLSIFGPLAEIWGVRIFWFLMPIAGISMVIVRRLVPAIYHLEDAGADGRSVAEEGVGELSPVTVAITDDAD